MAHLGRAVCGPAAQAARQLCNQRLILACKAGEPTLMLQAASNPWLLAPCSDQVAQAAAGRSLAATCAMDAVPWTNQVT